MRNQKDGARAMRDLIDYNLLNNRMIKFESSEIALLRATTKDKGRSKLSDADFAETLGKNERKRLKQLEVIAPIDRATIGGQVTLVTLLTEECNKNLNGESQLQRSDVGRAMNQLRDSEGKALSGRSFVTMEIPNRSDEKSKDGKRRDKSRVPFHWLIHNREYRDPARSRSGDSIHLGAHPEQKWYAITQLQLWGRKEQAGRRGSKFEGLGYQPLGKGKKYRSFVRVGYPQRSSPDRLTTQHQYSLFYQYWKDKGRVEKILSPIKNSMVKELNLYISKWQKKVRVESRRISSMAK